MKTSAEVKCVVGTAEFLHQSVYQQIFASADFTLIPLLCDQPNARSQTNPQTVTTVDVIMCFLIRAAAPLRGQ
jgi:hypothetical protein